MRFKNPIWRPEKFKFNFRYYNKFHKKALRCLIPLNSKKHAKAKRGFTASNSKP